MITWILFLCLTCSDYLSLQTALVKTRKTERRRQWHPTPVPLPGKSHGRRSLVGCSPWGREELDTTEQLHFHVSLSCIGEGNGNPLQCSCLENPRDGGAWWAAIYGVVQNRTQLKRLSSGSRSSRKAKKVSSRKAVFVKRGSSSGLSREPRLGLERGPRWMERPSQRPPGALCPLSAS